MMWLTQLPSRQRADSDDQIGARKHRNREARACISPECLHCGGAGIRNVVRQRRSRAGTLFATDMPIEAPMLRAALISDKALPDLSRCMPSRPRRDGK